MHCEYNTGEELEEFAYEQFCEWARKCHSLPMKEVKKQGRKRTENVTTLRNASIQKKLNEDLKKSSKFYFMGLQGSNFLHDTLETTKTIKKNMSLTVRYLVAYPFSDEIRHRLEQLPDANGNGVLRSEQFINEKWRTIFNNLQLLREECLKDSEYRNKDRVEVRYFTSPIVHRLLFTDEHLFFTYYEVGKESDECVVYCMDADTPTYKTYLAYYEYMWSKAKTEVPVKNIPREYAWLMNEEGKFEVIPSLVINVCAECDMNCIYCSRDLITGKKTGGENLISISERQYCNIDVIKNMMKAFAEKTPIKDNQQPVLRITGGEPLYGETNQIRTMKILSASETAYNKIVLCTNGISLQEAYLLDEKAWNTVREKLLLKISFDTCDVNRFKQLTGKSEEIYEKVKSNIQFMASKEFRIELNVVLTSINFSDEQDILDLFEFAKLNHLVGIKLLTVNDFGGKVTYEQSEKERNQISQILQRLIEKLKTAGCEEKNLFLNDDKGIMMRRFYSKYSDRPGSMERVCTLTIVDHHNYASSVTPTRTFASFCKECKFYSANIQSNTSGCATGVLSLTLRADGLLSPCRLLMDEKSAVNISEFNEEQIATTVGNMLSKYTDCWHE